MSETVPDEQNRFEFRTVLGDASFTMKTPALQATQDDGTVLTIEHPSQFGTFDEPGFALYGKFLSQLAAMAPGNFLEIGSRARSGTIRRHDIPPAWKYIGFDALEGDNVDVLGDAHNLSASLPQSHFNAVMSIAVFEHLLMPWKVAIEMNRVMTVGALAYISTHQTFPLHDEPCDYLRFSKWSWPAFFNQRTGFRVIEADEAAPVYVVAKHWSQGADHGICTGMTISSAIIEKTGDTDLTWPVDPSAVVQSRYPG